jgi:hypothetical protein
LQKDSAINGSVRFIERVVFRERPAVLMIDRAVQSEEVLLRPERESKDVQTQTSLLRSEE